MSLTHTEEYSNGMSVSMQISKFIPPSSADKTKKEAPKKKVVVQGKKRGPYKRHTNYKKKKPKQKKSNENSDFDVNEDRALTTTYLKYARLLKNHKLSQDTKRSMWEKIVVAVNAQGPINRSMVRVKKRLNNIKAGCK